MRFTIFTMALLLLVTGGLFLNEGSNGDRRTLFAANVDPLLLEALEEADEVVVIIAIRALPIPGHYWSADARAQPAAEYQESILAALADDDFTVLSQNGTKPWLIGRITLAGVEKLQHHPYVLAIDATGTIRIDI